MIGEDGGIARAFELKSFTGRVGTEKGRRTQVSRSLKRAAELKPESWTLIVPIDPTPREAEWFSKLGKEYTFPTRWLGKTWLDEKMSAHPEILRYFVESTADEVLRLLGELREEQAIVTDVHDAIGRFRILSTRLNEIDPYYHYQLSTGTAVSGARPSGSVLSVGFDDVRVDLYERYAGATLDRPIRFSFDLEFDSGDAVLLEDVKSAFDYGLAVPIPARVVREVKIDAPGGLGGNFSGGEIEIGSTAQTLEAPIPVSLVVMDGETILASWLVHLTTKTTGLRGVTLTGNDHTDWIQIRVTVNPESKWFNATFNFTPQPIFPAILIPLLRWLEACRPPHQVVLRWPGGSEMRVNIEQPFVEEGPDRVVEALAYLQERSGVVFPMPLDLSPEEAGGILSAEALLRERSVEFTWSSFTLGVKRWSPRLEELLDGEARPLIMEQDEFIEVGDSEIPLGRVRIQIESARVADSQAIREILDSSDSAPDLELVPGESNKGGRALIL